VERIMLELRLATGLPVSVLTESGRTAAKQAADDGFLRPSVLDQGRCVLTDRGRLLADAVVQQLIA
jgi:hypothetical protein